MRFSPSQLATFTRCGEQWRRRYLEGEKIPPGIAAHTGTGVHRGAEANHRQKIATKRDMKPDDVVETAVEAYAASLSESGVFLVGEEKTRKKKALGEGKDNTARLAKGYCELVAPNMRPIMVEESITIDIAEGLQLGNILDVVCEGGVIADLKTGARLWTQARADDSLQLTANALTYEKLTGEKPSKLTIETLGLGKAVSHATIESKRRERDFNALIRRLTTAAQAIAASNFQPASPDEWYCSPRWCGYYETCPYR